MRELSITKLFFLSILLFACNSIFAQSNAGAPATMAPPTAAPATTAPPATAPAIAAPAPPPPAPKAAPRPAPKQTVAEESAGSPAPAAPVRRPKSTAPVSKPIEEVSTAPAGYSGPVWKKQITHDIEMGEKVDSNVHRLREANANNTLLEMFAIAIKNGKISSFYTSEFSMATRIKVTDFGKLFVGQADTVPVRNAAGKFVPKIIHKNFNYAGVHKYRILEEWTSYPGIGKTEIQIVGIAPLKDMTGEDGKVNGVEPLFWVHYTEDIKAILLRYDEYNPNTTLGGQLWADYFSPGSAQK